MMQANQFKQLKAVINKLRRGIVATISDFSLNRVNLLLRYFWYNKIRKETIPQVITVGVTYSCQCRCVHCSSGVPNIDQSSSDNEMTTSQIKDLIDQAVMMGIPRITFFGGEPLMRKDLFELISYANSKGMLTRINTNGLALTEKVVVKLREAGLTHCDVSIDDSNPEIHDKLRGVPGLFRKATQGIMLLKKHKMLCQIVTYAGKRNVTAGLQRIIDLGRKLDVTSVSIVFPMATGCWFESFDELLNEDQRKKVMNLADSHFVHVEIPTSKDRCNVVKKASLYVSPEGNVTPCPFIPWSFGNFKSHKLDNLVKSFYNNLNLNYKGDCIMNNPSTRDLLNDTIKNTKKHISCRISPE
jgi:MoaA/NifB/PqqE/SkfB family radical SAM enzyme